MNIYKGLMFLQGHFVRPEDLDDGFAPLGNRSAGERWNAVHPGEARAAGENHAPADGGEDDAGEHASTLLDDLLLMAGRLPRGRGRNLILDVPFEPGPAANDAPASARRPTACATC